MIQEEIKIAIVGDCSDWNQKGLIKDNIPSDVIKNIKECDIFIFNLEGPLIDDQIVAKGPIKNIFIKNILNKIGKLQPIVTNSENLLNILCLGKKNIACLANNHILDAGSEGIDFTLKSLEKNKFIFTGAGKTLNDASKYLIIDIKNRKIGILNYNFIGWNKFGFFFNIFGATQKRPGSNYANKKKIIRDIYDLSKQVEYTIAIIHIGKELHEKLSLKEKLFLESLKVDLIVIHHAHMAQSTFNNKVISCGDFIFNYPEHLPENRLSKIVIIYPFERIEKSKIIDLMIKMGIPHAKKY